MSDHIPQEVVLEILTRLPARSLLRFRCVSKSWCSLISSPSFITMHTHQTTVSKHNTHKLIRHYSKTHRKELYSVHFDNETLDNYDHFKIEFPFKNLSQFYFRIVGSCNGLLCLSDDLFGYTNTIILWNPAIRRKLTLPIPRAIFDQLGPYMFVLGFGFDPKSIDYKIVRIAYVQGRDGYIVPPEVEIYTVSTGAWRGVSAAAPKHCIVEYFWSQAFINGAVHWVAYHRSGGRGSRVRSLIMTFDMVDEVFREMILPKSLANESPMNLSTTVFGESLVVFQYDTRMLSKCCSIWVMKEYGVVESWSKQYDINLERGLGMTLGLRKNGEILLAARSGELISYHSGTQRDTNLGIIGTKDSFYVYPYSESLALLIEGNSVCGRQASDNESDSSGEEDEDAGVEENELWMQSIMVQFLTALLLEH